ncbi:hypothetical protein GH714_005796 [Hevea brasiliensis]|uniref:E3 ubiquitin-protein ligase RMA n=1 Tax=Hevea brasiliensis TaxID=3981 RepID=A0A6A6M8G4_HEVBR|nr:hypothetical protein GH714_005796 [Hevea brasiliensis]
MVTLVTLNAICFDLAQDPIVTLCGHLFCWPCLYKWLHFHSQSKECPVCKALVQEEKLVPLYGRGKTSTDPRSKSIPGVNIPNRPAGQRPETAPPPEPNHFAQRGFGFMGGLGGFAPMATARFGNFTLSAAFGGLSLHFLTFSCMDFLMLPCMVRLLAFHMGSLILFMAAMHMDILSTSGQGQQDYYLKRLLLFIGFVFFLLLFGNSPNVLSYAMKLFGVLSAFKGTSVLVLFEVLSLVESTKLRGLLDRAVDQLNWFQLRCVS